MAHRKPLPDLLTILPSPSSGSSTPSLKRSTSSISSTSSPTTSPATPTLQAPEPSHLATTLSTLSTHISALPNTPSPALVQTAALLDTLMSIDFDLASGYSTGHVRSWLDTIIRDQKNWLRENRRRDRDAVRERAKWGREARRLVDGVTGEIEARELGIGESFEKGDVGRWFGGGEMEL